MLFLDLQFPDLAEFVDPKELHHKCASRGQKGSGLYHQKPMWELLLRVYLVHGSGIPSLQHEDA